MNKIYSYRCLENYKRFTFKDLHIVDYIESFEELRSIEPIDIVEISKLDSRKKYSDFPYFSPYGLLCSERAYHSLNTPLNDNGNWVKMKFGEIPYFYFVVSDFVKAVNMDETKLLVVDGDVLDVEKLCLKNLEYSSNPIFRLKEFPNLFPYVNSDIRNIVQTKKLVGLEFTPVDIK